MALRNDPLTRANPYTNHLRYALDSFELCPEQPCLRVRYMLPGLSYSPDADATRIAPSPKLAPPKPSGGDGGGSGSGGGGGGGGAGGGAGGEQQQQVATGATETASWRAWSGRDAGSDAYEFGDLSRALLHHGTMLFGMASASK